MRTPKPTEIKLREGTYRKDRVAQNEFKPTLERNFEPPDDLNEWGRKLWIQIATEYAKHSLITIVDNGSLFAMCNEYGVYCEASDIVAVKGIEIDEPVYSQKGEMVGTKRVINPARKVASDSFKNYRMMCVEFGLTPASRTRVGSQTKKNDHDPFAEYE